jgi:hypothetical protein
MYLTDTDDEYTLRKLESKQVVFSSKEKQPYTFARVRRLLLSSQPHMYRWHRKCIQLKMVAMKAKWLICIPAGTA